MALKRVPSSGRRVFPQLSLNRRKVSAHRCSINFTMLSISLADSLLTQP